MQDLDILKSFKRLFEGSPDNYMRYTVSKDKYYLMDCGMSNEVVAQHLYGSSIHVGTVPAIDETYCGYGCLDYDNHDVENGIDLMALDKDIKRLNLPLIVCRSKSGSAHVYLFGKEPLNIELVKMRLNSYKTFLNGYGELDIEVYPKQALLPGTKGNTINLPYANSVNTKMYALKDGAQLSLNAFVKYANDKAVTNLELEDMKVVHPGDAYKDAPPCLQALLKTKLDKGSRNNAIYNFCVYAKAAFPSDWHPHVYRFNNENMTTPLPQEDVSNVITSVSSGKGYRYKCGESPCKDLCNSSRCVTTKFGITPSEQSDLAMSTLPEFGRLRKYVTDPVSYDLDIQGVTLSMGSTELLDFRLFKKIVFEKLDLVLKPMKAEAWLNILDDLIKNVELIEVPDDASGPGLIRAYLSEYIKQCNLDDPGIDVENRQRVATGSPVVQKIKGTRSVYFKGLNFKRFLSFKKAGTFSQNEVWKAIAKMGVHQASLRIGKVSIYCWAIPLVGDTSCLANGLQVIPDEFDIIESGIPVNDSVVFKSEF